MIKSLLGYQSVKQRVCYKMIIVLGIVGLLPPAQAKDSSGIHVEIRRTSYGIPHILAHDEASLGYGIGHSYAEDNFCLLANEVITVSGERSKYFGGDLKTDTGLQNLASDFFFRWLNNDQSILEALEVQPKEIRALLVGYAAGYNRYLRDTGTDKLPVACRRQFWVREISERDLIKIMRRLTIESGLGRFAGALVLAAPPEAAPDEKSHTDLMPSDVKTSASARLHSQFEADHGSNAIALGRAITENGRGLLLGNPHFPWSGALRFYEMHLTIPGALDVMGASLPGLPIINIGFTQNIAWSHTVDKASHFTIYELRLDPDDPTKYLVDGRAVPMKKVSVSVEVREANGILSRKTHDFYETIFGPVITRAGQFDWDRTRAFTIRDANLSNNRAVQQWYAMDRAKNLPEFEDAIKQILGIPWVNTLATDSNGLTTFMDISAVPNLHTDELANCRVQNSDQFVLDGSQTACEWKTDGGSVQGELLSVSHLPSLHREDYVQNSNDSAWLTNPSEELQGISPLVGRDNVEQSGRTRYALSFLETINKRNPDGTRRKISPKDLKTMVMSDEVYAASIVMDDLNTLCREQMESGQNAGLSKQISKPCGILRNWDRTADATTNIGYVFFEKLMKQIQKIPKVWQIPFNPAQPISTPRRLDIDERSVRASLIAALISTDQEVAELELPADVTWGQIQVSSRGSLAIPIHGGSSALGVYNVIESRPSKNGKREVVSGSSYIQVVTFDENGPLASAVLTFSESSNPESSHYSDQTELFSKKEWVTLPFMEKAIQADLKSPIEILTDRELLQ